MSHVADPLAALLTPTPETAEHVAGCAVCATSVRAARGELGPGRDAHLPDPSRIRQLARGRRAARTRRRTLLGLFLALALGVGGKAARDAHVASVDLADDQLLRSIGSYQAVPDIGGLGGWVEAGLEAGPGTSTPHAQRG